MRGTLLVLVLVLAAAITVGLWYLFAPSDTPVVTQPETAGPLRDPTPATGDSQTVDSGTASAADGPQTADSGPTMPASDPQAPDSGASLPSDTAQTTDSGTTPQAGDPQAADSGASLPTDVAQTTDSGTTAPQAGDPQAPDSDAALPTDVAQTTDSGTTPQAGDPQAADPGAVLPTDVAQTTDSGTAPQAGDPQAPDSDAALPTDVAQTTDSNAVATAGIAQAAETGTVPATNAAQATDSSAAEATLQIAAVEKADQSIAQELVLAPAPEGTIERTPIDAPSEGESDQTDIVSVVARELERIKTAIQERLDADTKLHVQIEYDDSPEDAAQVGVKRNETDKTAGTAAAPPAQVAQTTDTDTASPARPAQTADSAATRSTNTLQTTDSGVAPPAAAAQTTDTGAAPPASVAPITDTGAAPPASVAPITDSDAASPANAAQTTDSDAASPANAAQTTDSDATEAEAKLYVETLTETTPQTIPVDKADHFVTQDHVLSLVPEDMIESVSVGALANDEALKADTPITVVREVEQIETAVPEQLIAEAGGDLDTRLRVLVKYDDSQGVVEQEDAEQNVAEQNVAEQNVAEQNVAEQNVAEQNVAEQNVAEQNVAEQNVAEQNVAEQNVAEQNVAEQDVAEQNVAEQNVAEQNVAEQNVAEQITVREILERILAQPAKPISIIKTVRYFEVMTLRELLDSEEDADTFLNVVTRPYRLEAATLADLLQRQKSENPDTIFYLHTVQPTDEQGIWGIVHFGLIENFARGMAVKRGEKLETYTVRIPGDADERLHDQSSSFLGKLIDRKTEESFVYNFRNSRMGRNPDRIYPGQEIVIIHFEPEELISIYKHFATG